MTVSTQTFPPVQRCDGVMPCSGVPGRCAFTLIELLISVAIMGLVITAIASAIAAGVLVWDTARHFDADRIDALLFVEGLEREVRSTFPFHGARFEGGPEELHFAVLVGGDDAAPAGGGSVRRIGVVRYRVNHSDRTLTRETTLFPSGASVAARPETVLSGGKTVRFSFCAPPDDVTGGATVWLDEWRTTDGLLPGVLRVEIGWHGESDSGSIVRTISIPSAAPREKKKGGTDAGKN